MAYVKKSWREKLADSKGLPKKIVLQGRFAQRWSEKNITPYWRTLKAGGELNPKYPGGVKALKKLLAAEGHKVVAKGKRFFVADFGKMP